MFSPELFSELKTYNRKKFLADCFAGITVGILALPLAMAFSIASGLGPEKGIFTAIVAGFIISFFGGSKVQIGGPTGAFIVIVSGITAQFGYEGLVMCMLLAGIMLLAFGLCRMGGLIKFIPFPVTTGFTSAIAVIIFSTQIKDLLGLNAEAASPGITHQWASYIQNLHTIDAATALTGLATIMIIVVLRKYYPKLPGMLIAMALATIAATILNLDIETIGSKFGDLPRTLPMPHLPALDFANINQYIFPALTVALLTGIESLLSATVADGMTGNRHKPDTELIAQGLGNIGSLIFGGIPATGAIARTATNVKSGAKTPVAGCIHAITLTVMLLLFAPMAKAIPLATLAAILVVVSYNMCEARHFLSMFKGPKSDTLVLVATFLLTLMIDLTVGVGVGVVLSSFLFTRRMAELTNVAAITGLNADKDISDDPEYIGLRQVPDGVDVFEIQGPFFFAAAEHFKNIMHSVEKDPKIIVLRLRNVPAIDATAIHVLKQFHSSCLRQDTVLLLTRVQPQPLMAMNRAGLLKLIGRENILDNIDQALDRAKEILGLADEPRSDDLEAESKAESA